MPLKVTFKFDESITLDWDCAGIKPFIESIAFLHELPRVCPVDDCGAPLHFFFRSPQGNSYYGLKCEGSPAHECNFGQHKEGGTLYYKGDGAFELEYSARTEGGNQGERTAPASPGSAAAPAPAQSTQAASPKGDKAPIEKLNMIGAVARAKKVADVDAVAKEMLGKGVSELTTDEAEALLGYLKTL